MSSTNIRCDITGPYACLQTFPISLSNCFIYHMRYLIHTHHRNLRWYWITLSNSFSRFKGTIIIPVPKNLHVGCGNILYYNFTQVAYKLYFIKDIAHKFPIKVTISFWKINLYHKGTCFTIKMIHSMQEQLLYFLEYFYQGGIQFLKRRYNIVYVKFVPIHYNLTQNFIVGISQRDRSILTHIDMIVHF